ncbi:MAG: protein-glutamate O-methyltransferase CheR [Thermoplasmata archaeon]|nr:MAG: protein-glutamate O-methyltransferase CheR [Thermoplasmata archaeon]
MNLSFFKSRIGSKLGLDMASYNERHLERRLLIRMRALKISTYGEYLRYLNRNPEEIAKLKEVLTVNVTEFLRNPETYKVFRDIVIPELFSRKKNIKIWSAGCSDGKEPYSIAILILDFLKGNVDKFNVKIIASDIDDDVLNKAKIGWYPEKEFVGEIRKYKRYFIHKNGGYEVKKEIKRLVSFKKIDLLKDGFPLMLDVIFCRNVIIYFKREAKEALFEKFWGVLNKGGYLILGKTEMLFGKAKNLFVPVNSTERIYKKP